LGGLTEGGGLFASGSSLTLVNDTVAWNELSIAPYQGSPAASGGGLSTTGGTLNLTNTVIALNQIYTNTGPPATTPTVSYDNFDGPVVSGYNLMGNSTKAPNYAVGGSQKLFGGGLSFPAGEFFSGQFPANYGGLTYTLPLAWNSSPAISTG